MKSSDLSILFISCDKYSDLWKPLFQCVDEQWPDCPYPMYLGSNTKKFIHKKLKTVLSGPDSDWSSSLKRQLSQLSSTYVFLWLDDMFPIEKIDTQQFTEIVEFMKKTSARHIHMVPNPSPDRTVEQGTYGMYEKGAPYRATALGFWNVEYLKSILIDGENPWNFEILGSYRTRYSDGFYCLMKPLFNRLHVVEKGKIFSEAADYCRTHSIPLDIQSRKILQSGNFVKSELQKLYFNTIIKIPWKYRVRAMNTLRKLFISY